MLCPRLSFQEITAIPIKAEFRKRQIYLWMKALGGISLKL
jgi:hypothetical protein